MAIPTSTQYKLMILIFFDNCHPPPICSIVPNLAEDILSPTANCDSYDAPNVNTIHSQKANGKVLTSLKCLQQNAEDDEIGDGLRMQAKKPEFPPNDTIPMHQQTNLDRPQPVERRRRKLPEIPKNKKCNCSHNCAIYCIAMLNFPLIHSNHISPHVFFFVCLVELTQPQKRI